MAPSALLDLIAVGETQAVEFKGDRHTPLSDDQLVEAIVCLANRSTDEPAWLLVGSRTTERSAARVAVMRPAALISSRTLPTLTCAVESVSVDDGSVIVVAVPVARTAVATSR